MYIRVCLYTFTYVNIYMHIYIFIHTRDIYKNIYI